MKKYGKLIVVDQAGWKIFPSGQKHRLVKTLCECGGESIQNMNSLKSGGTKSCGCMSSRNFAGDRTRTHGMSKERIYNCWGNMIRRCYCKTHKSLQKHCFVVNNPGVA